MSSCGMLPGSVRVVLENFGVRSRPGRFGEGLTGVCSPGLTLISRPGPGGGNGFFSNFLANCSTSDRETPALLEVLHGRGVIEQIVHLPQRQLVLFGSLGWNQGLAWIVGFLLGRRRFLGIVW